MAKFKTAAPTQKNEISFDIPLPEEAHEAIREDSPKAILVRFSPATVQKITEITDSLLISRKIVKPEVINQSSAEVMLLAVLHKDVPIEDIIYNVQFWHEKWALKAQQEAGFIALTLRTKLKDIDPEPYTDADLDDEEDEDDREDWEGKRIKVPMRQRHLTNSYERRLKQFLDMLDLTDLMFQVQVGQRLNNVFIDLMRQYGAGEVSDANFQPLAADGRSNVSSGPAASRKGNPA